MFSTSIMQRFWITAVLVILTACGTADPVAYKGLESSSYLTPDSHNESGHIPYRYSIQVDWHNYSKVIVDPVAVYRGLDHQFGTMSEEDKISLAKYMQTQFAEKLAKRFQLTNAPGPNTLRVKLTLTGAETNTPFVSAFTHFDMGGNLYNGVQAVRGGEGAVAGSVIYAVEISDASNASLLDAYISKQYPGAMNIGASFGSLAAAKTGIEKGADALVEQLR